MRYGATISVEIRLMHLISGRDYSNSIAQANYVDMSDKFASWIITVSSNYVGIYAGGVPDISPSKMLDIEIAILLQYEVPVLCRHRFLFK